VWGIIVVAQRRGSLFPDDDRRLLAQLARSAATALDHARLIAEARARDRLVADRRIHAVESLMSLTLDSIKDYAMCLFDAEGRVVAWHAGAEQLFGYTASEIAGEPGRCCIRSSPTHSPSSSRAPIATGTPSTRGSVVIATANASWA
jgi:PAS domain-containing protein